MNEKGIVSTDELCRLLNVSQATINRDINTLSEMSRIVKTHGGAMDINRSTHDDIPISKRKLMYHEEKQRIAEAALGYIQEGQTYFIDAGTTTFELAVKIRNFKNISVLTNDINIAYELNKNPDIEITVAGGTRKKPSATLTGMFTEHMLKQLHVDKAFISVDAVDIDSGFMDYNTDEIVLKRTMINNSSESIVLCDHAKFKNKAFISICALNQINLVITGNELDQDLKEKLKMIELKMILV